MLGLRRAGSAVVFCFGLAVIDNVDGAGTGIC